MAASQFPVFSSGFARLAKGENIFTQTGNMSDEAWGKLIQLTFFFFLSEGLKTQSKYINSLPRGTVETKLYNLQGNYPQISSLLV